MYVSSAGQPCPTGFALTFSIDVTLCAMLCQVFLHTGDMRWHPRLALHPAMQANPVHTLILDTTYCSPKWVFPPQVSPSRQAH